MATTKIQNLTNLGTITTGDKIVGERVAGTSGAFTYAVDVTLDTAPVVGGDLGMGTYSLVDSNLNELFKFSATAAAINEYTIRNAAVGANPSIEASGGDTNISVVLKAKGSASIIAQAATTGSPIVIQSGTGYQHTTYFSIANTNATRTVTYPDADGTLAYTALAYGGTNASLTADNGAIVYSTASAMALLAASSTAGKILQSGSNAAPTWSTPTYPSASGTARKILVSNGTNNVYSTETYAVPGSAGNLLRSDGTNWTAAKAILTTDVTDVLPVANGGTNASSASITAFNNITGYTAAGATGTTSTNLVFSTSPTLVTPSIGVATGTSFNGLTGAAAQSDQETATSTTTVVTPGRQQYHPCASKAWAMFTGTGTPGIVVGFNAASVTDNGVGDWKINFTTNMSSGNYSAVSNADNSLANTGTLIKAQATTGVTVRGINWLTNADGDLTNIYVVCFGDQ